MIWDKSAMPEFCRSSACLPPGYNKRPTSVGSLRAKRVDDSFFKTGSAEMIESTLMCFLKNSANGRNGLYAIGHKVVVAWSYSSLVSTSMIPAMKNSTVEVYLCWFVLNLDTSTRVPIPGTQCTWGSLKHRGGSRSFPKYQHEWYARRWLSFTPYELCWHFIIKHHSAPLPPPLHAKPLTCQGRSMIRSLLAPLLKKNAISILVSKSKYGKVWRSQNKKCSNYRSSYYSQQRKFYRDCHMWI